MKGFQLWFAENKSKLSQKEGTDDETVVQGIGLQQWKAMTKTEKEIYKELRVPKTTDLSGGKRKHESSDLNTDKKLEANIPRSVNKLAKFAAPQ